MATLLGVWAHPDDETYLSAGLMAAARDAGDRVVVVTATRGELAGDPRHRERELQAALAALDVHEHGWLAFADGACDRAPLGIGAVSVLRVIEAVQPDTILTFGPDGLTGHPDHRAVSRWTTAAWRSAGRRARLLYATLTNDFHAQWGATCASLGVWMEGEPPSVPASAVAVGMHCEGSILDRKLRALRAHASQTDGLRAAVGDEQFDRMWVDESFVDGPGAWMRALSA